MGVTELNAANYESFVQSSAYAVIHFWADWNRYDDPIRNVMKRLAEDLKEVGFASFDTSPEENWPVCQELHIKAIPTLVFYRKGERIKTLAGAANYSTKPSLLELITLVFGLG